MTTDTRPSAAAREAMLELVAFVALSVRDNDPTMTHEAAQQHAATVLAALDRLDALAAEMDRLRAEKPAEISAVALREAAERTLAVQPTDAEAEAALDLIYKKAHLTTWEYTCADADVVRAWDILRSRLRHPAQPSDAEAEAALIWMNEFAFLGCDQADAGMIGESQKKRLKLFTLLRSRLRQPDRETVRKAWEALDGLRGTTNYEAIAAALPKGETP